MPEARHALEQGAKRVHPVEPRHDGGDGRLPGVCDPDHVETDELAVDSGDVLDAASLRGGNEGKVEFAGKRLIVDVFRDTARCVELVFQARAIFHGSAIIFSSSGLPMPKDSSLRASRWRPAGAGCLPLRSCPAGGTGAGERLVFCGYCAIVSIFFCSHTNTSAASAAPLKPRTIMMNEFFHSPIKFYGFCIRCILLVVLMGVPAHAQDEAVSALPSLFDARERIARPDLTGLVRLRFLTTVSFPPFNFIDQSGRLSGLHVDLVREICRELRIEEKCQIQAIAFEELQGALSDGQGEAVAAGVAVTADLRRSFEFSRPFLQLPARFAINNKAAGTASRVEDLEEKPVGVVTGTVHEAMLKAFFPQMKQAGFASRAPMLAALRKGDVASVFSDGLQLSFWVAGEEAANCCRLFGGPYLSQHFLGEGLSIMTRKADVALARAIDSALVALSRNGRMNEIYLRYFPNSIY